MNTENETIAIRSIERAAVLAVANPLLGGIVISNPNTNRIVFYFSLPTDLAEIDLMVDPLPYVRSLIKQNENANTTIDEEYVARAVLEMVIRFVGDVRTSIVDSAATVQCDLGPMIGIRDLAERKLEPSTLALPNFRQQRRGLFGDIDTWRMKIRGVASGQGNKPVIGPHGEERACEAVAYAVPHFVTMRKQYKILQKDWEHESRDRNQVVLDPDWEKRWKETVGPKEFSHLSGNTLASFVDSDPKKRTPTFLACSHIAPVFGLEPTTLESKFKAWKLKRKPLKIRTQTA